VGAVTGTLATTLHRLRSYDPESKGGLERRNGFFEISFMPRRDFTSPADFDAQLTDWLTIANARMVRTSVAGLWRVCGGAAVGARRGRSTMASATHASEDAMPEKYVIFLPPEKRPAPIPRSCSDVFRLWAAIGLAILFSLLFAIVQNLFQEFGFRKQLTPAQQALEEDYGSGLITWVGFALAYLWLGAVAFRAVNHAELVRRILGSPLPRSAWKRWILAGGGSIVWPVGTAIWAFMTVVTAVINRKDVPVLVLTMAGLTVLSCIAIITFSFALYYARKDIEEGGLEFPGPAESVFSDYVYLAAGCSVTFGTTDTTVTSASMRRMVTFQSVMAWILNTIVIATFLSLLIN